MRDGLRRHGIQVEMAGFNDPRPCDFAVVWGWKQFGVINAAPHTLVMEQGYVGDRMKNISVGWDGLNGRARFASGDGSRWRQFEGLMQPWKSGGSYALLCGQVPGDASLAGTNHEAWLQETADRLTVLGLPVLFRPHPLSRNVRTPRGATTSAGSLADDLTGAAVVLTFNSNSGVDAALAGVPTVALDAGSMARPVAADDIRVETPDRTAWVHRLAWCQWTLDEISNGTAWEHLRGIHEYQADH